MMSDKCIIDITDISIDLNMYNKNAILSIEARPAPYSLTLLIVDVDIVALWIDLLSAIASGEELTGKLFVSGGYYEPLTPLVSFNHLKEQVKIDTDGYKAIVGISNQYDSAAQHTIEKLQLSVPFHMMKQINEKRGMGKPCMCPTKNGNKETESNQK